MTAIAPVTKTHYSFRDFSNELTKTQVYLNAIDDAGNNDTLLDTATGDIADVGAALATLTKLEPAGDSFSVQTHPDPGTLPTDPNAQREWGVRWIYSDNVTGRKYRFDTPAPIDSIIPSGGDNIDLSDATVAAFKTVFESACNSPVGNAVTLISGTVVARRS